MYKDIVNALEKLKNTEKAKIYQRFFKTGKGEYGEGDVFYGIVVPELRKVSKKFKDLDLKDVEKLLNNRVHEFRMVGVFILILKFSKEQKKVYDVYMNNLRNVNNWDLVDLSAPNITGVYLLDKNRSVLYQLAKSENLWERRVAMLSCFTFIRKKEFEDALKISRILLEDEQDLMHKAVGWMLREIGKRDLEVEEKFLKECYLNMPRTMLRYAIEKFPEEKRQRYLKGEI
jgi:3-methyladenine DNA glycosylase AlkD